MMDNFQNLQDSVSSPARMLLSVSPADGVTLPYVPKAVYVGSGGDLVMRCVDDEVPTTLKNVPTGAILPVRPSEILNTGTNASDLVLLV